MGSKNSKVNCQLLKIEKVRVFDVANKKQIGEFTSTTLAGAFTGIKPSHIGNYIHKKIRSYKNKLGITICFR
jgi:hypothetical protein